MDFKKSRKGYDPRQVDEYIKRLTMEFENKSAEQRDRIFELKSRLAELEKEAGARRGRKADISRTLLTAVQKSQEMEEMARKKYDLEIQRLKLFHIKWQAYFDEILARYPLNDELQSIAQFSDEMRGILGIQSKSRKPVPKPNLKKTDAQIQHEREKARLAAKKSGSAAASAGGVPPLDAIHKYLDKNAKAVRSASVPSETAASFSPDGPRPAFSLEEALNPTQDITEILKELGIE